MKMIKTTMKTLSAKVNRWMQAGYGSQIIPEELKLLNPANWRIDGISRFEGMSDPADNAILYAVSTVDGKRKSIIVDSFGADNDEHFTAFIKQVPKASDISYT